MFLLSQVPLDSEQLEEGGDQSSLCRQHHGDPLDDLTLGLGKFRSEVHLGGQFLKVSVLRFLDDPCYSGGLLFIQSALHQHP